MPAHASSAAPSPEPQSDTGAPSHPSARLELLDAVAAMDVPFLQRNIAHRPVLFVNDPELISEVLHARAASFEKCTNAMNRGQRKLLGRVFSPAAMRRHVREVAALTREERDRWANGATVELGEAFMRLSTRIVARTLFSWELGPADDRIVDDLARIGSLLGRSARQGRAGWEDRSAIEQAAACIETRLQSLVDERRRRPPRPEHEPGDVIDLLLDAQAAQATGDEGELGGYVMTDRQIRDDLLTLFITGAENPRNALTWTFHLLSHHPEVAQRTRNELDDARITSANVTLETLQRLPYTLQVFKEALRLYPPGYAFGRRAVEDVRIGTIELQRGTEVVVSPYALHRRASLFERPLDFDPTRFEKQREAQRHPCAYLPFGVGPHSFIGGGFALMAGHTILAILLSALRVTPASDAVLLPDPRMTLRPSGPASVIVHRDDACCLS